MILIILSKSLWLGALSNLSLFTHMHPQHYFSPLPHFSEPTFFHWPFQVLCPPFFFLLVASRSLSCMVGHLPTSLRLLWPGPMTVARGRSEKGKRARWSIHSPSHLLARSLRWGQLHPSSESHGSCLAALPIGLPSVIPVTFPSVLDLTPRVWTIPLNVSLLTFL